MKKEYLNLTDEYLQNFKKYIFAVCKNDFDKFCEVKQAYFKKENQVFIKKIKKDKMAEYFEANVKKGIKTINDGYVWDEFWDKPCNKRDDGYFIPALWWSYVNKQAKQLST